MELLEVSAALPRLPDEQREVLVLVCIEELSYRDTADILSIPIGTVMSRLARARKNLAELTGISKGEKVAIGSGTVVSADQSFFRGSRRNKIAEPNADLWLQKPGALVTDHRNAIDEFSWPRKPKPPPSSALPQKLPMQKNSAL